MISLGGMTSCWAYSGMVSVCRTVSDSRSLPLASRSLYRRALVFVCVMIASAVSFTALAYARVSNICSILSVVRRVSGRLTSRAVASSIAVPASQRMRSRKGGSCLCRALPVRLSIIANSVYRSADSRVMRSNARPPDSSAAASRRIAVSPAAPVNGICTIDRTLVTVTVCVPSSLISLLGSDFTSTPYVPCCWLTCTLMTALGSISDEKPSEAFFSLMVYSPFNPLMLTLPARIVVVVSFASSLSVARR